MADELDDPRPNDNLFGPRPRRRRDNGVGMAGALAAALAVILIVAALLFSWWPSGGGGGGGAGSGGRDRPGLFGERKHSGKACDRPQFASGRQPKFGEQQAEVRLLRRRAFRGDFFSQVDLAKRYEGRADDRNLRDPVEAAVWYAMALANPMGYAPTSARERRGWFGGLRGSAFDDCRASERSVAYRALDRQLSNMTSKERDKVRDRVTYVLYTQGSEGMRVLARLHDAGSGPFGEPSDNGEARWAWGRRGPNAPAAVQLFERNDVDAYMYDYLAHQAGDVGAFVLMNEFVSGRRRDIAEVAKTKAASWVPPYEFYPPDAPDSGTPHSDESRIDDDQAEYALQQLDKLPFKHVSRALKYLGVSQRSVDRGRDLPRHDAATFQAMLGRPLTGELSPIERVRAIQYAAVNGSPDAQLVLAVMYSEGVGVLTDYARAFYWYLEADRQGSAEAKYAISNFFSLGVAGIADQDRAKSVVYQIDAALSGFKPSADRLREVLRRVGGHRRPRDRNGGYGRGGAYYPPPASEYPTSPPPSANYPATTRSYPDAGASPDETAAAGDTRPVGQTQPAAEGAAQ